MGRETVDTRYLWAAFVVLFGVVTAASALPVRPIVVVFPLWSVVVIAAMGATLVVAVGTAVLGWPAGGVGVGVGAEDGSDDTPERSTREEDRR